MLLFLISRYCLRKDIYQHFLLGVSLCFWDSNPGGRQGNALVINQSLQRQASLVEGMLAQYVGLNNYLQRHAPDGEFPFEGFGWSEAAFTPLFKRVCFLDKGRGFVATSLSAIKTTSW